MLGLINNAPPPPLWPLFISSIPPFFTLFLYKLFSFLSSQCMVIAYRIFDYTFFHFIHFPFESFFPCLFSPFLFSFIIILSPILALFNQINHSHFLKKNLLFSLLNQSIIFNIINIIFYFNMFDALRWAGTQVISLNDKRAETSFNK